MTYFRTDISNFVNYEDLYSISSVCEAMKYFDKEVNYVDVLAPGIVEDISGAIYMYASYIGENGIAVFLPEEEIDIETPEFTIDISERIKYVIENNQEYLIIS